MALPLVHAARHKDVKPLLGRELMILTLDDDDDDVCMYVCMYVCIHVYVCVFKYISRPSGPVVMHDLWAGPLLRGAIRGSMHRSRHKAMYLLIGAL